MTLVATVLGLLVLPVASVAVLLLVAGRVQRARDGWVFRQVAVTDAIHRELGAVVAPVVKHRLGRGWRIEIAVPFDRPALVGRVVAIAHAALLRSDVRATSGVAIVLRAQAEDAHANVRRLQPAAPMPPAREREIVAWTGTTTSRAS